MNLDKKSVFIWLLFIPLVFLFFFFTKELDYQKEIKQIPFPEPIVKGSSSDLGFLTREGVVSETNKQREEFDLSLLSENEELNKIAMIKLEDMFQEQYFAHISPEGVGVSDIAKEEGYEYLLIGDNLAFGPYEDDEILVEAWMNSEGHRENILNPKYQEIGVAVKKDYYQGRETWMAIQVFGVPFSVCPSVDESLRLLVEEKRASATEMMDRIDLLEDEIEEINPQERDLYNEKTREHSDLVKEYNETVAVLEEMIDDYNEMIKERQDCLEEKNLN
jgi:hypothetical protein